MSHPPRKRQSSPLPPNAGRAARPKKKAAAGTPGTGQHAAEPAPAPAATATATATAAHEHVPVSAAAAAQEAIDIAAATGAASDAPVRVPSVYPLETGLVDYGLWVEMFTRAAPPTTPSRPFQRGRIWA